MTHGASFLTFVWHPSWPLAAWLSFWRSPQQKVAASGDIFTDITESSGIRWKHTNGESNDRTLIEPISGGVAFVDFDNDGLLDIFLVAGGEAPRGRSSTPPRNALYRNLGNGKFEDVAAKAGVDRIPFYGMGIAAADYDNDGFQDLYVTGYPSSALFHNNGDGTFTDVTEKAGVQNAGKLAASAVWFDYNRDGHLDLFVANCAKFSFDGPQHCEFEGQPTYCAQTEYEGDSPRLYHNNGDGTFTDVTAQVGLSKLVGRALGVVAIGIDDDRWPVLFVASDATPNLLLINKHNGTFEEVALSADVAFNMNGAARAGMGVDACDLSGNGRPDIVHTAFSDEQHAFFVNLGDMENNGRADAIFTCLNDTPVLLRNTWKQNNAWVGFQLQGTRSNRDAIGAKVIVPLALAQRKLVRWITGRGSESVLPRQTLGLWVGA